MKKRGGWILCCWLALGAFADAQETALRLDPNLAYQAARSNPVTYEAELVFTITAPYKSKKLSVWLPIPQSDLGQEVASSEITTFPDEISPEFGIEPEFENHFACFEFKNPQGAQQIRHRLKLTVWELRWNLDPEQVAKVEVWPERFDRYRNSDSQAVVADEPFEQLLQEIVPRRGNPLRDLDAVLLWTDQNLKYDHGNASLKASSRHALEKRRGHCSDYHGFCAAMGRLLGQPTRVVYGINTFPKASPSHCKLEAFLAPYGWVSFDVSETQKLASLIQNQGDLTDPEKSRLIEATRKRLMSGFRDNTWFCQTRGTDYHLAPQAISRVPVVRTIYAEADGVPLPDPDPSNAEQTQFAWMTAHRFTADQVVRYPFSDIGSLQEWTPAKRDSKPRD